MCIKRLHDSYATLADMRTNAESANRLSSNLSDKMSSPSHCAVVVAASTCRKAILACSGESPKCYFTVSAVI